MLRVNSNSRPQAPIAARPPHRSRRGTSTRQHARTDRDFSSDNGSSNDTLATAPFQIRPAIGLGPLPQPSMTTLVSVFELHALERGVVQRCASDAALHVSDALKNGWFHPSNASLAELYPPPIAVYNTELFNGVRGRALDTARILKVGRSPDRRRPHLRWARTLGRALGDALDGWTTQRGARTRLSRTECSNECRITLFVFSWHDAVDPWVHDTARSVLRAHHNQCSTRVVLSNFAVAPMPAESEHGNNNAYDGDGQNDCGEDE